MIHFIRDNDSKTLFELEVYTLDDGRPEINPSVDVENYSRFLLKQDTLEKQERVVFVFSQLDEARGWYWEVYRESINKNPTKEDVDEVMKNMVSSGAEAVGLNYITD